MPTIELASLACRSGLPVTSPPHAPSILNRQSTFNAIKKHLYSGNLITSLISSDLLLHVGCCLLRLCVSLLEAYKAHTQTQSASEKIKI